MTLPQDVKSPKHSWRLAVIDRGAGPVPDVLVDGGGVIDADSLALGYWADAPRLASRWDASQTSDKGNPVSRGYSTWYVLPPWMEIGVLDAAAAAVKISAAEHGRAVEFLSRQGAP